MAEILQSLYDSWKAKYFQLRHAHMWAECAAAARVMDVLYMSAYDSGIILKVR